MTKIRDETTLHELKQLTKDTINGATHEEIVKRTVESGNQLDRLFSDMEPHDRAVLVGKALHNVLQTAVVFDLDPVGCLVLAADDNSGKANKMRPV